MVMVILAMNWPLGLKLSSSVPEPTRSIALMALLGIALLGLLMIAVTMLGGHWVRKQGKFRRGPVVPPDIFLPTSKKRGHDASGPHATDAQSLSTRETSVEGLSGNADDTVSS